MGFLAELCQHWEAETHGIEGVRTVQLRLGLVLSSRGGALAKMLLPFRLGLGGRIGNGQHWMSWLSIDDAVGTVHHILNTEALSGPVNAVSPEPTTNRTFTRTLGRALSRPTVLPLPAFVARIAFGELADALLASHRVVPERLLETGYRFEHPNLEGALRHLLGRGTHPE